MIDGPKYAKTVVDELREKKKEPPVPDGFETKEEFIKWAIDTYGKDLDSDRLNRQQAIQDMKFVAGDQWDDRVLQQRIADRKPTLTMNRLPAFVGQLIGNRRLNETEVKVVPDTGGTKDVARIRESLIRSIQKTSNANFAYNKAAENQIISGEGNWKIEVDYAHDDVFEQDIKICAIPNPLSVVWDRSAHEPTGADAKHVFVLDAISHQDFKKEYPWAKGSSTGSDIRSYLTGQGIENNWFEQETYRLIEFWRVLSRKRTVALLESDVDPFAEAQVEDVTDLEPEEYIDRLVLDSSGVPIMREVDRKYAQMYLMTATDILEGPYELPVQRVPVIRCCGWEVNVGDSRQRWGLVRFLKDPQRLHNYWRSTIAEKLMMAPKGNWIAADKSVEGRENEWRNSHISNDPLLTYNSEEGPPPQRVPPVPMEPALVEQAGMASQDLHDISNLHQASLGQQSNEVSGQAIMARQRVGETGTAIYETNLQLSIEETGKVLNQLIPLVYDTPRTIKIMGPEAEKVSTALINDTTNSESVDITLGRYSITSSTGPSYVTKRVEAGASMLNMVNAAPQAMQVALDKIVEAQDWPGADAIAARLRTQLPPGVVQANEMTDEEKQAQVAAQEAQQAQQARDDAMLGAQVNEKNARAEQALALAQQAIANSAKMMSEVGVKAADVAASVEDAETKRFYEAVGIYQDFLATQKQSDQNDRPDQADA